MLAPVCDECHDAAQTQSQSIIPLINYTLVTDLKKQVQTKTEKRCPPGTNVLLAQPMNMNSDS